jgi:hypothetical protein
MAKGSNQYESYIHIPVLNLAPGFFVWFDFFVLAPRTTSYICFKQLKLCPNFYLNTITIISVVLLS